MAKARRQPVDLGRLCAAMNTARLSLRKFRGERREAVREYLGAHWSEEGADREVLVNLISMYVMLVGRALVSQDPRFLLTTFDRENRPAVSAMQQWVNEEVTRMGLREEAERVVIDSLFGVGIMKVALATPASAARVGWNLQAGQPFATSVDLDDFVFDTHARKFSECTFIGHRVRVPLEAVRGSSIYAKYRKKLTAQPHDAYNREGDERIGILGQSYYTISEQEFEDHIDLWEIYLPRRRRVLTLADAWIAGADDHGNVPLLDEEWLGPDVGPFHILGLMPVPGNAMPKAPIQDLIGLHLLTNKVYRKLENQADRQKENLFVSGGADPDGNRYMTANDGEIVRVDNPENLKQVQWGGPNNANFLFGQHAWQLFSKHAGNLEMLGGLAPQSKTATQDKLLAANASGVISNLGQTVTGWMGNVGKALCWYWWNHPRQVMTSRFSLPGLPEIGIVRRVTPGQRQRIPFDQLQFEMDPYSMTPQTPQTRLQGVMGFLQAIQPFMQLAASQGVSLDMNKLVAIFSRYQNLPELTEVLQITEPPQGEAQPQMGGGQPGEPKEYVRRSLGGEGEQSETADLQQQLMGASGRNNSMPVNPNASGAA